MSATRWSSAVPLRGREIFTSRGRRPIRSPVCVADERRFGQLIQRSSDGGKTWEPVDNKFVYDGVPGTHQWYDGTPLPGNSSASGISSPR